MKVKHLYDLASLPFLIFGSFYIIYGALYEDAFLFAIGVGGILISGLMSMMVKFLTLRNFITTKYPEYSQHNEMDFTELNKKYQQLKKELKK